MPRVAATGAQVAAPAAPDLVSEALLLLDTSGGAVGDAGPAAARAAPSGRAGPAASPPEPALKRARKSLGKVPAEVPPDCTDRYNVLMALPIEEVRDMLRQVDLPDVGAQQRALVIRLVRHLAELPPARADEKIFAKHGAAAASVSPLTKLSSQDDFDRAAMEETRKALEANRLNAKPPKSSPKAAAKNAAKGQELVGSPPAPQPPPVASSPKKPRSGEDDLGADAVEAPQPPSVASSPKKPRSGENDLGADAAETVPNPSTPQPASPQPEAPASEGEPTPKKPRTEGGDEAGAKDADVAKADGEASSSDSSDDEEDGPVGDGDPGAVIVPVSEAEVELLDGKTGNWAKHFRTTARAAVELSIGGPRRDAYREESDVGPPTRLIVETPNGQQECDGEYVLDAERRANGLRVWRKAGGGAERWLYSGRNDTWFIGGAHESSVAFECSTGYLNLAVQHCGCFPDSLQGKWRRSDGKQWVEDDAIRLTVSPKMGRPHQGLHVRVAGVTGLAERRRFNGRCGRITGRGEGADVWCVRLADGQDQSFSAAHLVERSVPHAEVWIRGGPDADGGAQRLRAMLAGVKFECLDVDDMPAAAAEVTSLDVPQKAVGLLRLVYVKLLMEQTKIVAALAQEKMLTEDGDSAVSATTLVIYGEPQARCNAAMRALVFIEKSVPGHYASAPLPTLSAGGEDFGPEQVRLAEGSSGDLEAHAERVAAIAGAVVEAAGPGVAFVGGGRRERGLAASHLRLAATASKSDEVQEVPEELEKTCARVRVPDSAYTGALQIIHAAEKAGERVRCFWTPPPEEEAEEESNALQEEHLRAGTEVLAKYDGTFHDAKIVAGNWSEKKATIEWVYNGSQEEISLSELERKVSQQEVSRRKRACTLASSWTMLIFGEARPRLSLALQVLAHDEDCEPGLWTGDLLEAIEELRSRVEDGTGGVAVEGRPIAGPLRGAAEKHGRFAQRRAALAAGCVIQQIGSSGLLLLGSREERTRGADYLRWILAAEQPEAAEGPSVVGADGKVTDKASSSSVEYIDGDGDKLEFRRRRDADGEGFDYFVNGERRIRDVRTLRLEGQLMLMLHLEGTSCGPWSPSVSCEVPTGHDHVARQVAELFRITRASAEWASRAKRDDVTVLPSTRGRNSWLRVKMLRDAEKATRTAIVVGGCGGDGTDAEEWDPAAVAEVHICSPDAEARAKAAEAVRKLLDAIPAEADGHAAEAASGEPGNAPGGAVAAAADPAAVLTADPKTPSDPRAQLRELGQWPKDYPAWIEVQEKVWKNHPKLAEGWFRVWSRSKDREYYVRWPHYLATFSIAEAMVAAKGLYQR